MTFPAIDLPLSYESESIPLMTFADGDTVVSRTIMENGVRVISQEVPATRSVGVSMWVPVGSRDEIISQAGSTHFLEHLLFKGTSTRSALDIAAAFDSVGGESNASTGKETTNYWARILDADVPMAVSVLTNMLTDSILDPAAFEMERSVIIDELAMSDDSPTDVVHDAFHSAVYGESVLARPVGGTPEIIRAVTRDDVWAHYMSHYSPNNLIVAAAGHINHDHLLERVRDALAQSPWADKIQTADVPRPRRRENGAEYGPENEIIYTRDVEQAHLIVGGPSMPAGDERRPVMSVLLSVLGGSMSSRLFQEIREKRGLCYSTYAFDAPYSNAGAFGMYAGTSVRNLAEVERIMIGELGDLAANGPTDEELERVRGQVRGGIALGLEDNWSRMTRLGRSEVQGKYRTVEATLGRINAVTSQDVASLAAELLSGPRHRAIVMPKER